MIVVDLRKQQALNANTKAIQQIRFTANLQQKIQESILFLKKQKKLSWTFRKEL